MPRNAQVLFRLVALLGVLAIVAGTQSVLAPSAGAAGGFVPISGSGSTFSQNAVDQWRRTVNANNGITVNYSGNGSTAGRNDFRAGLVDFADSEIPYGLRDGGVLDPLPDRAFGYMPITAGGTAFMYNLKIGGKRVTNLRLSGDTLTKIFTQQITNWSDPAIKADNPGLTLPPRKIVPVVRADGSGTTAQFTTYMAAKFGPQWDAYCKRAGVTVTPCGFTSFYPTANGMVSKSGSVGVAGFVAQDSSEGAITYVEYSYARNALFPVVKVLNSAGYYVEPTAPSVAVALLKAKLHPDLTQDLGDVYVNPDPRTYPLSSYSYMIIPKDLKGNFNTNKGKTLGEFSYYALCEGQQNADALGYSPLPVNLVAAAIDQVVQIPGSDQADNKVDRNNLSGCHNPTVSPTGGNLLAQTAPQPQPCDHQGPTQCDTGTGGAHASTPTSNTTTTGSNANGGAGGANNLAGGGPGGTSGAGAVNGADTGSGASAGGGADGGTGTSIDPLTGQPTDNTSLSGSGSSNVSAVPVSVDVADNRRLIVLGVLAVALLVGVVLVPPLVAKEMRRRTGPPPGGRS